MKARVVAVVVTYNRVDLLPRCLQALAAQTYPLQEIVVVDNASTDATAAVLREQFAEQVTVLRMAHNSGGAGGFHTGIARALDNGADWMWLMDDDGYPASDTLARLLDRSGELDILNPLVCVPENAEVLAFGLRLAGDVTQDATKVRASAGAGGIVLDEINPFNGTLVRSDTVRQHGNIKPEMFIWGDEVEFVLRVLKKGARVGTVTTAHFNHPANRRRTVTLGSFATLTECPPRLSRFFYRNSGFYTIRYRGLLQAVGKFVAYTLFLLGKGRLRELLKFWVYYIDGAMNAFVLPPSRAALLSRARIAHIL